MKPILNLLDFKNSFFKLVQQNSLDFKLLFTSFKNEMSKLIKILSIVAIFIFEYFLFKFSLEIGIVSMFLIIATFCIGFVLKKITIVVEQPDLVLSSEPFRDSPKNSENKNKSYKERKSDSENLIPGVDSSLFEQFRKKFNLKETESADKDDSSAGVNTQKSSSAAKAYDKAGISEEPENFDEELEYADHVRVTLSENVKILKELKGEKIDDTPNENYKENPQLSNLDEIENRKHLGSGEEALELLTKKHQALKIQNEEEHLGDHFGEDEDLFADEIVPLPGGQTLVEEEKEEVFEEDLFSPPKGSESYEDEEDLELSLRQSTNHIEKSEEAEGLLKLATKACESGRMEEAKAGLKSYFTLLNELGQSPSKNVLQLAEKLGIPFDSDSAPAFNSASEELNNSANNLSRKDIQKKAKKTDYSAVMDSIVKTLEKKEAYDEALPLLKDLLKFNRERVNISAMDPLFERIERAHASMNNDKDLVETYKEHLAIKQQLNDTEGELSLLDLISNHYENFGDQKAAKRYRAESQRIRAELNKK